MIRLGMILSVVMILAGGLAHAEGDCLSDAEALTETISGGAAQARSCLEEQYRDGAPVSMGFSKVRGVMEAELFTGSFDPDREAFTIYSAEPQSVCVVYHGRDGRYRGMQSFAVGTGWIRLPFATRYADQIAALGAHGLAVEAFRGPDCQSPLARIYFPVFGEDGATVGIELQLVAQTGWGSAQLDVYEAETLVTSGRCRALGDDATVRFDKTCDLPAVGLAPGHSMQLVTRAGNRFDSEAVDIMPFAPE